MLTLDKIYHAAFVLKEVARVTDVIHATNLGAGDQLYLKTENLQTTGSFKLRGAYYRLSQLSDAERAKGVVACSAGNHAQGVALAAQRMGVEATIFMPEPAPISKVEATKSYGAKVILCGESYDDAYQGALEFQESEDKIFIHPFDDEDVIAGQGTIGLEILNQVDGVEQVLVPIGGGGLISGIAYLIKHLKPSIQVVGVEAGLAPCMKKALEQEAFEPLMRANTFADGIAVKRPGDLTMDLCKTYVDDIVTVSEDEIATAILALMEGQKLVTEGAGAVTVAAALFDKVDVVNKKTVAILSGGNIDVNILNRVINRGLLTAGRSVDLTLQLTDKPGQLVEVSRIIAEAGANVVGVFYDQGRKDSAINSCVFRISMETRDHEQIQEIVDELERNNFPIIEKQ